MTQELRNIAIIAHVDHGKTSLLEAVYLSLQGTSFKGVDRDILQHDKQWWHV